MGKRRQPDQEAHDLHLPTPRGPVQPLKPKTEAQRRYLNAIATFPLTFGVGPAGTGKTYVALAHAAELLAARKIEKLIVARPAVEAGSSIGFLPGEFDEKFAPYFQPALEILVKRLGAGQTEAMVKSGRIVPVHLGFMRGLTFDNAFVILDEAQNTTPAQMKLFLTRIGDGSKVVVDGDLKQSDIGPENGLADALDRLEGLNGSSVIRFAREDIVRSGIVKDILDRYEDDDRIKPPRFMQP